MHLAHSVSHMGFLCLALAHVQDHFPGGNLKQSLGLKLKKASESPCIDHCQIKQWTSHSCLALLQNRWAAPALTMRLTTGSNMILVTCPSGASRTAVAP